MLSPTELKALPAEKLIYLLVDGHLMQEENGWIAYEQREPGCIHDFFNALTYALQNLEEKEVTLEFIQTLNALVGHVALKKRNQDALPGVLWFDETGWLGPLNGRSIQLSPKNMTVDGLKQILHRQEHSPELYPFAGIEIANVRVHAEKIEELMATRADSLDEYLKELLVTHGDESIRVSIPYRHEMHIPALKLINEFNQHLSKETSIEDKERIIITYTHST